MKRGPGGAAEMAPGEGKAPSGPAALALAPLESFEHFQLANGLAVVLHRDESVPITAVNLWYHVGSKDEPPTRTGLAHLLEHLMFEASAQRAGNFFGPIEEVGGAVNGSTGQDRTNYYELVPGNYLDAVLALEADRLAHVLPALADEKLELQRAVVMNERRQRVENQPYGRASEVLAEALFPAGHPYSWPVIGSMEHLAALSLEDVRDFCSRYYQPANAALVVAGSFDPERARLSLERHFGPLAGGARVALPAAPPVRLDGPVRRQLEDRVALARLDIAWPGAARHSADEAALDFLAEILGGRSKESRLKRRLVHAERLVTSVVGYHAAQRLAGQLGLRVYALRGVPLRRIEQVVEEELDRLRHEPPGADEVRRVRHEFFNHLLARMETVLGIADALNHFYYYTGNATAGVFGAELERYLAVTAADVQRAAQKYLGPGRAIVEVHPAGAAARATATRAPAPPAVPERRSTGAPVPLHGTGPEPDCRYPRIERARLPNGMRLMVVRRAKMPLVQWLTVVDAGAVCDSPGRLGLARLSADMLDEGAGEYDALAIARHLDRAGARLTIAAGYESTTISLRTLRATQEESFALLGAVVRRPRFAEADFQRTQRQLISELAHRLQQPAYLADGAIDEALYGPSHPYGRPSDGTEATVDKITPADLQGFHQTFFRPGRITLIAVGDITPEEAVRLAESQFGDWSDSAAGSMAPVGPAELRAPGLVRIARPGSAQAVLRLAVPSIPRRAPGYFPLLVLNTILGGQFSSRLNRTLREQKGCTYGARSELVLRRSAGMMVLSADVDGGAAPAALRECLAELAGLGGARPIAPDELRAAKSYLCRRFPSRFETIGQVAIQLAQLVVYGLEDDYYERYRERVAAVDRPAIEAAHDRHLARDYVQVAAVGAPHDLAPLDTKLLTESFG